MLLVVLAWMRLRPEVKEDKGNTYFS